MRKKRTLVIILIICCVSVLLSACPLSSSFEIKRVSTSSKPIVGQVVDLEVEIKSDVDERDVKVAIYLPEGIEITEGTHLWEGSLVADEVEIIRFPIRVVNQGEWEVRIDANGDNEIVYILSSPETGKVSDERSPNRWYPPAMSQDYPIPEIDERFESKMILSDEPFLNREITITYIVTSTIPITNAQVSLGFPRFGFELVSTELPEGKTSVSDKGNCPHQINWMGDLEKDVPIKLIAAFKITKIGRGEVFGYVTLFDQEGDATRITQTASSVTYLEVTSISGRSQVYAPRSP